MRQYTFTDEQLFELLSGIPVLFREYELKHGFTPGQARARAANDTIEGLIAERELFDHGELKAEQLTQVVVPALDSKEMDDAR